MTKAEAQELMKKGEKITKDNFFDPHNEFITCNEKGEVVDENGLVLPNFWKYRTSELWDDGYSLFDDK